VVVDWEVVEWFVDAEGGVEVDEDNEVGGVGVLFLSGGLVSIPKAVLTSHLIIIVTSNEAVTCVDARLSV
jgi:hypothetical protein